MNGAVELKVLGLELVQPETETPAVRVRAGNDTTDDVEQLELVPP